jgi:hypothetical protein
MGGSPLGLAYFAAVKMAGYTAAGYQFRRMLRASRPNAFAFGAIRTGLGLAVGVSFASLALWLGLQKSEAAYYLALFPVRLAEWLLVLWWFFARASRLRGSRWTGYALLGGAWSYLLDVPAIVAMFAIPGGAWIC